jgi:hypothetical protein
MRPPVPTVVETIVVEYQGLQHVATPVVELHLPDLKDLLVYPGDLGRVAGMLVARGALDDVAEQVAACLAAQVLVVVLLELEGREVLEGELAAHERTRLVDRRDALHPSQRRQVEPLVVRLEDLGMRQNYRKCRGC